MKTYTKTFRVDEELMKLFEELKKIYQINSDSELLRKIILDVYDIKNQKLLPIELFYEKEEELRHLYIKLGELQGELNVYKQKALPKEPFWKRWFGSKSS